MINAIHLMWIIPLVAGAALFLYSLLTAETRAWAEIWRHWARVEIKAADHYRRKLDADLSGSCTGV